jgi:NTE family protein
LIARHLGKMDFADAALPLHIVATDQSTGDEVILAQGDVEEALMASAAIPGIFPPVRLGDRLLVDGGVANNTPISTAISLGATRIYVLPTGYNCASTAQRRGLADHAMNALNLLIARQMKADIERYRDQVELMVAPALCPLNVSALDYSQSSDLIDRARSLTRNWLQAGGQAAKERPGHSGLHLHD